MEGRGRPLVCDGKLVGMTSIVTSITIFYVRISSLNEWIEKNGNVIFPPCSNILMLMLICILLMQ